MKDGENPFERYELDPREGPRGITERMKELAEDARKRYKGLADQDYIARQNAATLDLA